MLNKKNYAEVKSKTSHKEGKQYLSEQYSSASGLIRALDQRANTILRTAQAIVNRQTAFFEYGIMSLTPMTLADIAGDTGLHESTVSRVTTNKYLSCSFGIFEMKHFFTSSITNKSGENISSAKIKEIIKAFIEQEPANYTYSDEEIAIELSKFNISIALRTVAKYRESLNIPTSSYRKRAKKANF